MKKLVYLIPANRPPCSLLNRKKAARAAKLNRLKAKGLAPPTDKQSLRQAGEQAIQEWSRAARRD